MCVALIILLIRQLPPRSQNFGPEIRMMMNRKSQSSHPPPFPLDVDSPFENTMANPLFPTDTIKDVADSLGITQLSVDAAKQLAMDVEYRIQEVVQEAQKFMRHSKRTILSPADISNALKTLNIEVRGHWRVYAKLQPLYGYNSSRPVKFREATSADGVQLYFLDDEEIEFEKIINQPLPKLPRDVEFIGLLFPASN
jgi:histone H3/H4